MIYIKHNKRDLILRAPPHYGIFFKENSTNNMGNIYNIQQQQQQSLMEKSFARYIHILFGV